MEEFVRIALSFPPILFSMMLIVVVIYWIFMVLGVLDLDLFDLDVDLDVDLDIDLDVGIDGLADASIEGASESTQGIFAAIFSALSIGRVPITISFSVFTLFGWAMSFAGVYYLENTFGDQLSWLVKGGVFAATFILSLVVAGTVVRPMRGLFETTTRRGQDTLIGKLVRVSTGRVDSKFGQATLEDGGAGLILSIRCDDTENNLKRGQQALIVGYDEPSNVYYVEPYDNFLNKSPSDAVFDFAAQDPKDVLVHQNLAQKPVPPIAKTPAEAMTTAVHNASGEKL